MKPRIKVCGMKEAANIAAVADLQPDYMGFIFYEKSPRNINEVSAELIKYVPPSIKTVGVFVNENAEVVKSLLFKHKLKAVQLHGAEDVRFCKEIKATGVEVIKAFGIGADFDFEHLRDYLPVVDYFLFDTQTPNHGGSGKIFDWQLLQNYKFDKPYFLSGGVSLEQVALIQQNTDARLYAVDINSRFEREPGLKDVAKVQQFISEIKQ